MIFHQQQGYNLIPHINMPHKSSLVSVSVCIMPVSPLPLWEIPDWRIHGFLHAHHFHPLKRVSGRRPDQFRHGPLLDLQRVKGLRAHLLPLYTPLSLRLHDGGKGGRGRWRLPLLHVPARFAVGLQIENEKWQQHIRLQGGPSRFRPGLGWLRFGEFPRLVGRYCN